MSQARNASLMAALGSWLRPAVSCILNKASARQQLVRFGRTPAEKPKRHVHHTVRTGCAADVVWRGHPPCCLAAANPHNNHAPASEGVEVHWQLRRIDLVQQRREDGPGRTQLIPAAGQAAKNSVGWGVQWRERGGGGGGGGDTPVESSRFKSECAAKGRASKRDRMGAGRVCGTGMAGTGAAVTGARHGTHRRTKCCWSPRMLSKISLGWARGTGQGCLCGCGCRWVNGWVGPGWQGAWWELGHRRGHRDSTAPPVPAPSPAPAPRRHLSPPGIGVRNDHVGEASTVRKVELADGCIHLQACLLDQVADCHLVLHISGNERALRQHTSPGFLTTSLR